MIEIILKVLSTIYYSVKAPSKMIPYCPKCGKPMIANLRCDDTFVQDEGWYVAKERYDEFIKNNKDGNIVFLELGVGRNTPVWIKYPFWQMTAHNEKFTYVCLNYGKQLLRGK